MQTEQQVPEQGAADPKEIHERFVTNAMNLASGEQYDQMMSIAKSANNPVQALGRALMFIVSTVKKGLEDKGVQIPGELWLAENGIMDQVTRVVAALLEKGGIQQTAETVKKAMELVAQQMAQGGERAEQGNPEGMPPEQPQAAPAQPQQAPQGLLSQGQQA